MAIQHIWACSCGKETPCEEADTRTGSVWHCEECGNVFGCVLKRSGGKAWVTIDPSEVEFHDLLALRDDEDEAA